MSAEMSSHPPHPFARTISYAKMGFLREARRVGESMFRRLEFVRDSMMRVPLASACSYVV